MDWTNVKVKLKKLDELVKLKREFSKPVDNMISAKNIFDSLDIEVYSPHLDESIVELILEKTNVFFEEILEEVINPAYDRIEEEITEEFDMLKEEKKND